MATTPGSGTREDPWQLQTPGGRSTFEAFRDESLDPPALVVPRRQDRAALRPALPRRPRTRCSRERGDWVPLGGADEQKPAQDGTVEAWARSPDNPVGGWYGLKKGLRGRFGVYVPPVLQALGRAEVENEPRNNRMRAL